MPTARCRSGTRWFSDCDRHGRGAEFLTKPFREQDIVPAIETARARHEELVAARAEADTLSEALDSEAARMIRTGETEDHKEAARAFVEKRAPVFKGV